MCLKNLLFGFLLLLGSLPLSGQSFDDQLQEAVKPLLSLPAEQRLQLVKILKLYKTEFDALKEESTNSAKKYLLEIAGLKVDLTLTSEQLTELSKLLSEERTKHQEEVVEIRREAGQNQMALIGAGVTLVILAYILGGLK